MHFLVLVGFLVFSVFIFPMIHDLLHELGHATFQILGCGAENVAISLGNYEACDFKGKLNICFKPAFIYKSLYRESVTYSSVGTKECSASWSNVIGGISGIILSCFVLYGLLAGVAYFYGRRKKLSLFDLAPAWILSMVYPYSLIGKFTHDFTTRAILGLGALMIQFDLTNDFYYSFFPSRVVIFSFLEFGDGTKFWARQGYSPDEIIRISYIVFAAVLTNYLIWIALFVRFLFMSWKPSNLHNETNLKKLESITNYRLSIENKLPRQSLVAAMAEHLTEEYVTEDDSAVGTDSKKVSLANALSQEEIAPSSDNQPAGQTSAVDEISDGAQSDGPVSTMIRKVNSLEQIVSEDQIESVKLTSPQHQRASVAYTASLIV